MSKYVEADKLAESLEAIAYSDLRPDSYFSGGFREGLRKAAHMLREEPSADVVPTRYGTWNKIKIPPAGYNLHGWKCSECGYVDEMSHSVAETAFPYCPHCGAKMDVETP